MGIFDTVAGWMNLGGPTVEIVAVHAPLTEKSGLVIAIAHVTARQKPATLLQYKVSFYEEYTVRNDDDQNETRYNTYGKMTKPFAFDLQPEEQREIEIVLPYDMTSRAERWAEKGGLLGFIGRAESWVEQLGRDHPCYLSLKVDVAGAALDPSTAIHVPVELHE